MVCIYWYTCVSKLILVYRSTVVLYSITMYLENLYNTEYDYIDEKIVSTHRRFQNV